MLSAFVIAFAASRLSAAALQENKTEPVPCPGLETLAGPGGRGNDSRVLRLARSAAQRASAGAAGIPYYRGLDKRVRRGDQALRLDFEPVSRLRNQNLDLPAAAALEWTVKGIPVGVIVSTGIYNGRFELDFVGLGTGIGSARAAVQGEHDARRR